MNYQKLETVRGQTLFGISSVAVRLMQSAVSSKIATPSAVASRTRSLVHLSAFSKNVNEARFGMLGKVKDQKRIEMNIVSSNMAKEGMSNQINFTMDAALA